jgi:hypothetical protein
MRFFARIGFVVITGINVTRAEIALEEPQPRPKPTGIVTATPAPPASRTPDADVVKFRNGDVLHGTVAAVGGGVLQWRRSDVAEPIGFALSSVGEIGLGERVAPAESRRAVVELTNGDAVAGELVNLDGKTLTLQTWFAGRVTIQRPFVQRVMFVGELPAASYSGPNSLEEWKSEGNRNAWSFQKGALYAVGSGQLARDVKLPAMATIEFDVAWRGNLNGAVGFGFEEGRRVYQSGGYMVQFNYATITLQRYRANQGSNNLGQSLELPELQRKTKMRVALRVNQSKKQIALFLDGTLARQWSEPEEWAAKGTALVLMAQGQGQWRISNLTVAGWDGRLDGEVSAGAKDADLVRLNNGDQVSGTVKSITNGQIALTTSFAEMNVPVERAVAVELASATSERARRQAGDVEAFFLDGRKLTVALDKLDEQQFTGTSENFGRMTAALGAFRRLRFHIYEKREAESDDERWGGGVGNEE